MGSQAQGRMPEVKPQGGGPQPPEVEEWVWPLAKHTGEGEGPENRYMYRGTS